MKYLGEITNGKDLTTKEYVDGKIGYGVCSTAASTATKTVTIEGLKLVEGTIAVVKFTNSNSASSPKLDVNGLGAKPMYRYGTTALSTGTTTTGWYAGSIQVFVYDGTGWVRDYWNNTTYSNAGLGCGYGTCATAEATTAKAVTLSSYALTTGGIVAVKFTYAVPAGATMNINSKGAKAIYHRGSAITAGVIKAGDTATFVYNGTYYHLLCVDRDEVGEVGEVPEDTLDVVYSTSPIAIGLTSDGKTVYRKTVETVMTYFTKPSSGYSVASVSLATTATKILKFDASIYNSSTKMHYVLPYCSTGSSWGTWLKAITNVGSSSACVVDFYNNTTWGSAYTLYITVDYTVD